MKKKKSIGMAITVILSIFMAILFLGPVIWSFACSFQIEGKQIVSALDWFKPPYTLSNYPDVFFHTSVSIWIKNSFIVTVSIVVITLIITSMAAYPLAKMKFRGRNVLFLFLLLGLIVPGEATIIPLFIVVNKLNLLDSYVGMISPTVAVSMNLVIMVSFFQSIPKDIIEAAKIDGAQNWTIFYRMILPMAKSVLVTIAIFSFMGSWNNYLWPLLCAINESMFTLPVGIPTFSNTYSVDYIKPMTANMLASFPAIIIYMIFEKKIVKGVSLTGIKG